MLIRNGMICDAIRKEPYAASIRVTDGKIAAIAPDLCPEEGEEILNAAGCRVYPGFIDAHSHMGLDDYGLRTEGADYNEYGDITSCQLRAIDSYYPMDAAIRMALEAGVTTVGVGPGSSNVLGGTFMAVKTYGNCVDDSVVRQPVAMKCAFGENPKRCYKDKGDSARMTTAAKLREMLFKAREYHKAKLAAGEDESKLPKYDMKMEALEPVIEKRIPLKAHAHRADDICTALRIAREFDVNVTLEHCTEGHLIVDQIARAGVRVAVGPSLTNASKPELINKTFATPGILAAAGIPVSIITDAPVIPQQYLPLCAGLAVKSGMDPFDALRAITIRPAEHLGIADRVGSIEVGKDADFVLTEGDPLVSDHRVVNVIVDGKVLVG